MECADKEFSELRPLRVHAFTTNEWRSNCAMNCTHVLRTWRGPTFGPTDTQLQSYFLGRTRHPSEIYRPQVNSGSHMSAIIWPHSQFSALVTDPHRTHQLNGLYWYTVNTMNFVDHLSRLHITMPSKERPRWRTGSPHIPPQPLRGRMYLDYKASMKFLPLAAREDQATV